MKSYAAYYDNDEVRLNSSSGGIFSVIASKFDVVYGVSLTEDCYEAIFKRSVENVDSLRGSKYLQAKMGDTFKEVKKDLNEGKLVLFSGTGCQINGLKLLLGKDYDNLFCLDIICHGAPSPLLWKEYLKYQEKQYGKISNVNFRSKENSWQDFGMKENQVYISKDEDSFMRMFLRDYCLRPSCYNCKAKNYRLSDITIGDFWGIESVCSEMNDNKGTSFIVIRSSLGQQLFDSIKNELVYKEVSYEDGIKGNVAEYKSVNRPELRNSFFEDLHSCSFDDMKVKYAPDIKIPWYKLLKRKLRNKFKRG